ncbi:MAG: hypothetical protein PHC84_00980, partial [Clostridia bacterium]|nr:hypothetical protein [Clostridia bacterium]
ILSKNGAKGYLTLVRVGGSVGIKVVVDCKDKEMTLALRIGAGGLIIRKLDAAKTEFELHEDIDFKSSDEISCVVLCGNEIYAEGGVRGRIQLREITDALKNEEKPLMKDGYVQEGNIKAQNKEVNYGNANKKDRFSQQNQTTLAENSVENSAVFQSAKERLKTGDETQVKSKEQIRPIPDFKSMPDARSFYFSVKDRLDELFVMYPREETLEKIIPSSKWVKINYDKEDYYVAGVLVEEDAVTHIAYGVPGYEGKTPPKETECICDWLPVKNMPKFQGYWLIFQSADTGEILPKD